MTDAQLLKEFADSGSEEAFTELVKRHAGTVQAAAFRQTGRHDWAEEVTQAVFVLLARKAGRLSDRTLLIGWLMHATRYAASDLLRTERRRRHRETSAYQMNETPQIPPGSPPLESQDPLWDRIAPVLDACLARLRDVDRNALLLRFFQNQSLAHVGASLGIAEDAARKRVNRALDRLRAELAREGAVTPLAALPELLLREAAPAGSGDLVGSTVAAALASPAATAPRISALSDAAARTLGWPVLRTWLATGALTLAVATAGWWTLAERLPARPDLALSEGDYRLAGFPDAALVHRFIRSLQRDLRAGDREAVVLRIRYPLEVRGRGIRGPLAGQSEVLALFERVFTESVAGEILKCPAQHLHCTPRGVMIGGGSVWIAPAPETGEPQIVLVNLP